MRDLSQYDKIKTPDEWIEETLAKTKDLKKENHIDLSGQKNKGKVKNVRKIEMFSKIAAIFVIVVIISTGSVYAYNGYIAKYKFENSAISMELFNNNVDENGTPYDYEGMQKIDKKAVGTRDDVEITVEGIITEPHKAIIRFKVKEKNGGSLISNDENHVSIVARQGFEKVKLIVGDKEITSNDAKIGDGYARISGNLNAQRIDDVSNESEAIFELTVDRDDVDFTGQKIKLVLENYTDSYYLSESCGFMYENVAELVAKGQLANENEFFGIKVGEYFDGSSRQEYHLGKGNLHVPFSDVYKDAYIDNMGFHSATASKNENTSFFMTIVPGKDSDKLKSLCFKNLTTGTLQNELTHTKLDDGRIEICVSANHDSQYSKTNEFIYTKTTMEHLKNYILVLKNPNKEKTENVVRYEGKWEMDIQADKAMVSLERTKSNFEFPEEFANKNKVAKIISLKITDSTLYMKLEAKCDEGVNTQEEKQIFMAVRDSLVLIMNDGTRVKVGDKVGSGCNDNDKIIEFDAILSNLIVSKNIKAVEICGYQVELD